MKINKKYTKNKSQAKRMKREIKRFKNSKDNSAYFQWKGDTNYRTGKRYKTKRSSSTIAYNKKYNK